ncbi:MAG TPA: adenylate/guanylate cyclase domain-containing protein [Candidatus Limnocylindria bacterium]|jgi:class 3 adenylate cyclase|nr:adenylate/guanylate cyclase domain-containing protein [Candidatus Limnocylindria bacterium]
MADRPDELRPITALFADISGSTGLGERLAPDEVKALIGECVTRMSRAVEEYGGTVQAYQGDGICAYFGVPVAHEDDPERAARAALRIVELMAAYGREVEAAWGIAELGVRVGVNSGRAGVGLVGSGDPQVVALGDATNVAARLESQAVPGTIVVGEETARRLAGRFVTEPLGEIMVKGRAEAVATWRLVGPEPVGEVPVSQPLVGREAEMGRLNAMLDRLVSGQGQVTLVVGEAGIGKTRLLAELRGRAENRVTWLEGHSRSYGARSPFGPFVEILRQWLHDEGGPELAVRTRLRARLGADGARLLPELARLLGIRLDPEGDGDLADLPPADLGARLRSAYVEWLRLVGAGGPACVVIEDVNWADDSSADLAADVMALTDRAAIGLIVTLRPDPATRGWGLRGQALTEYSHRLTTLDLEPLSVAATEELAALLLPGEGLDPATRRTLGEVSEGNPLFLEELVARLQETGALAADHHAWTLTVPRQVLPPALEGLLVARIDYLSPEVRAVAQAAAVLGREFTRRTLERMIIGDGTLDASLDALIRGGVIVERGRFPAPSYAFRHGLILEAVLSTLTDARRAELHLAAARAYEEGDAADIEAHLEELAHHYARANDYGKALTYLERGAERAAELGATDEAGRLWLRALRAANKIEDGEAAERIRTRISNAPADKA